MEEGEGQLKPTIGSKDVPPVEWVSGEPIEPPNPAAHEFVTGRKPSTNSTTQERSHLSPMAREAMQAAAEQRMRDHGAMRDAELRYKPLLKAEGVARADAWFTSIGAVVTLLSGIFGWTAFVLGALLVWVSINSFKGLRKIKNREPNGFVLLAKNQGLLAIIVIVYCCWCIWEGNHGKGVIAQELAGQDLGQEGIDIGNMEKSLTVIVYSAVAAGSAIVQGLMALYYLSKRRVLEEYLEETPDWLLKLGK